MLKSHVSSLVSAFASAFWKGACKDKRLDLVRYSALGFRHYIGMIKNVIRKRKEENTPSPHLLLGHRPALGVLLLLSFLPIHISILSLKHLVLPYRHLIKD
jgi:hypothetical protein